MRVIVKISDEAKGLSYSEDVTASMRDIWRRYNTNGANPQLKDKTFDWWVRPIACTADDIDQFNNIENNHFIFGWMECFAQSHRLQEWMYDADTIKIEVLNEKDKIYSKDENIPHKKRLRLNKPKS